MLRTNIYLPETQVRAVDEVASRQGISRSEVIRQWIDDGLAHDHGSGLTDAIIDESFGILRDLDVPPRGQTSRQEHLDNLWRQ
ncbi:MAG: ribbon-helix-helix domain-containing protein [Propionibacteriaceae bacterium]|nr:ribbon-helix-helix domain-containing protein [Propionibacteriaceae bacterium]